MKSIGFIGRLPDRYRCLTRPCCVGGGFGWANFDFSSGDDGEEEDAEVPNQRRAEPRTPMSCSAVQEDLANWVDTLKAKGPVSSFLQRQLTCAGLLVLLFAVRAAVRKAQMLYYPDEPPPGDMAFPGWEGPGEFRGFCFASSCPRFRILRGHG
jgi:hypothetical protein